MEAAVNDVLVSIGRHPLDESIPIPYVGVRGPLDDVLMPEWQVRDILELETFPVRFAQTPLAARIPEPECVPAVEVAPAPAPEPETVPEPEAAVPPEAGEPEPDDMTPDEVVALRDRIRALSTVKAARALAAEFGLELPVSATKLEDMRAALLAPVEAALAGE